MSSTTEILDASSEWPDDHKLQVISTLQRERWLRSARLEQLPPEGQWRVWYLQAGRGAGKTKAGAEWLSDTEASHPPGAYGIIAPTFADGRDTCVEEALLPILGKRVSAKGWNRSIGELHLRSGSRIYIDGADDGALRIQGKNLRAAWCIAHYEAIMTSEGEKPIREVRRGDVVWTRDGWKPVTRAWRTKKAAQTVRVVLADGRTLDCTPEHQVWTDRGWVAAGSLAPGHLLTCLTTKSQDLRLGTTGEEFAGTGFRAATTRVVRRVATAVCTSRFGNGRTIERSRMGSWFTTSTRIVATTGQTIWNSCRRAITTGTTSGGPFATMPLRSAFAMEYSPPGKDASRESSDARSAGSTSLLDPVAFRSLAPRLVAHEGVVASVGKGPQVDVYDLTVEDSHEFFAGGILVHNCDEVGLWNKWDIAWNESLAYAVRIEPARIVATGTPKMGHGLVRQLVEDASVVKTRMSMADNIANLPRHVVDKLYAENKGTFRGRQELDGEWISHLEGDALKRAWWRYYDPKLLRNTKTGRPEIGNGEIKFQWVIISADTPLKDKQASDNVAIQVWGVDHALRYLLDAENRQMSYDQAKRAIREKTRWARYNWRCQSRVLIENAGYGPDLAMELKREVGGVETVKANMIGNKGQRALAASGDLETGQCFLPGRLSEDGSGPDPSSPALTLALVDECAMFQVDGSHDSHDDQVDAWSQCMNWLRARQSPPARTWSSFKTRR